MGSGLRLGTSLSLGLFALAVGAARAEEEPKPVSPDVALSQEDRIAELERVVQGLTEELARTQVGVAVPEDAADLSGQWGYGPAASKVYEQDRGLSIGGYGEGFYTAYVGDKGSAQNHADMLRAVLYTGYKFNDWLVFNSEIEFEHATTEKTVTNDEGGSVSVEFAALDFMYRPELNARTGLLLLPVGFLNLIHEPPFYFGVNRPDVERVLIPSTWRENGAGLFGHLFAEQVEYAAYAVNGMNAQGFNADGIRDGRQNGSEALAEDLAFVGRLDYMPLGGLLVGASVYAGDSGQDQRVDLFAGGTTKLPSVPTVLWDVHAQYEYQGLHLRGLFTMTHIGDAGSLTRDLQAEDPTFTEAVAEGLLGGYGEVAYDVLPLIFPGTDRYLAPFYRFEWYDTQWNMPSGFGADRSKQIMVNTVGIQFEPIPNVVLKADYRNRKSDQGSIPDEFNLGFGYAF